MLPLLADNSCRRWCRTPAGHYWYWPIATGFSSLSFHWPSWPASAMLSPGQLASYGWQWCRYDADCRHFLYHYIISYISCYTLATSLLSPQYFQLICHYWWLSSAASRANDVIATPANTIALLSLHWLADWGRHSLRCHYGWWPARPFRRCHADTPATLGCTAIAITILPTTLQNTNRLPAITSPTLRHTD